MDYDKDGRVVWKEYKFAFGITNLNRDGEISKQEFGAFYKRGEYAICYHLLEDVIIEIERKEREILDPFHKWLDTNGDGVVDYHDVTPAITGFDLNGDGVVTVTEMEAATGVMFAAICRKSYELDREGWLRRFTHQDGSHAHTEFFSLVDANKDGNLSV